MNTSHLRRSADAGLDETEDLANMEFDPAYWRGRHRTADYADPKYTFDDYEPAYRYGEQGFFDRMTGTYRDHESHLSEGWDRFKGASRLTWEQAKEAARTAWHRLEEVMPGDADRDGR